MGRGIIKQTPIPEAETLDQFLQRGTWQYRAVESTLGNQSKLGCILLAVLGKSRDKRAFSEAAGLTKEGYVIAGWYDRDGAYRGLVKVCDVQELCDNFSGLADHLQLSDADRIALFAAVRNWIAVDERAIQEPLHFTKGS